MIKICTSEPSVVGSSGADVEVRGPAGVLLRMLLLDPHRRVPVVGAAAVMGIAPSGFGQYVKQLRNFLGDDNLVIRVRGHIWFGGDRDANDAALVDALHKNVVARLDGSEVIDLRTVGEIMPDLEEIERLYHGNPAMGLSGFDMDEIAEELKEWAMVLDDVVSEWMERWSSVQLLLAECRMTLQPSRQTGRRVLAHLLKIARNRDPDEEVFPRLLQAAQMSQDTRQHRNAWEIVQNFYFQEQMEFPEELLELAPPDPAVPNTPWAPHRARPLDTPLESAIGFEGQLHEIARVLGITTDSTLSLRGAEIEPASCIARTTRRLYFSGILASKWVLDPGIRSAFEEMLTRLDEHQADAGDARFMIIDPEGDAYRELLQLRGGRLSKESVPHLRDLCSRHSSFEVRVVNALPAFRIVVIDDDIVSFSPYALGAERYATSRLGWAAPHVLLDPLAPYPLADAFRLYFEERWLSAKPL